jgi:hypothetical protein
MERLISGWPSRLAGGYMTIRDSPQQVLLSPTIVCSSYLGGSQILGSDALADEFPDSVANTFYCDMTT